MIFWDACAIIYFVESREPWASLLATKLIEWERRYSQHAASELSLLECRVKPLRENNLSVLGNYDAFLSQADLALVPLSTDIILHATELRAQHNLKTPDAIQAACALQACPAEHVFVTNDNRFDRVPGLNIGLL